MVTWAPRMHSCYWLFAELDDKQALLRGLIQFCAEDGCGLELN